MELRLVHRNAAVENTCDAMPGQEYKVYRSEKLTSEMSNIGQTRSAGNDKFYGDVGGIHTMPEQKCFRGRHRV
jgi:hypothetical protein